MEVSKDSLKALRDKAGKCENSSNKKTKYDDKQKYEYLTKRNEIYESLIKQNEIQLTIPTYLIRRNSKSTGESKLSAW